MEKQAKINRLLASQPAGIVLQSAWLTKNGYSPALQQRYRNSQWLQSIGKGAMIRTGDEVGYEGAVYALQSQSHLSVHPGGKTALAFLGKSHYLPLSEKKVVLFGHQYEKLPTWFLNHDWDVSIDYHSSSSLPPDIGISKIEVKGFSINISGAARAFLECLYLAPELMECSQHQIAP